jgi:L-lactate dehydrogenase complex protein LldG
MSSVAEFQQSLSQSNTESTVTTPETFAETLAAVVDRPAVGAALPFEDVDLADAPVTLNPTPAQLREAKTGVTAAGLGVASLGTVAIQSRAAGDELVSIHPETHVVVVRERDLCPDLDAAFDWLEGRFDEGERSFVLATGASATGDMGALVEGVHGPEDVHVIVLTDDE